MVVNTETDNLYSSREEQSKWEFFAKIFKRKLECLSKHRNKISSGAIYEKHATHLRRDSHAWNFNGIRSRSDTITGITLVRIGRKASLSIDDLINKCLFHFFFLLFLSRDISIQKTELSIPNTFYVTAYVTTIQFSTVILNITHNFHPFLTFTTSQSTPTNLTLLKRISKKGETRWYLTFVLQNFPSDRI